MPVLIVTGGEYQGKVVEFYEDRFTLGRDFECDLILNDENVSGEHARVVQIDNEYFIQDLSSVNGTTIGGRKIVQQALQEGQEIEIGPFKLIFLVDVDALDREREATIEEVRQRFHTALIAELDLKQLNLNEVKDNKLRRRASDALDRLIDRHIKDIPKETNLEAFKAAVLDAALGLGPLEELLADDAITEIMVNSPSRIFIEKGGRLTLSGTTFSSEAEVMTAIERIVGPLGRRIDESSPMVDARLSDGSRVNAIIPPLALDGPSITIRKFAKKKIQMSDLVGYGSISEPMAKFLDLAGLYAQNMIISGGTGSGKTTLLNICSGFIPETERIITIEDSAELQLPQEHVVRLETRPPNIEGKGAITIRDLVKNALRMRPDRIVVGECRGGETLDMLQAMNTGHDGSLSTAHANSPEDTLKRLETMVLMSGMELPLSAIRELVFSAVGLIVQITRFSDGSRKVISICELDSLYENEIKLQEIFKFERSGLTPEGKVQGHFSATGVIPGFIEELRAAGINVDMSIFVPEAKEV